MALEIIQLAYFFFILYDQYHGARVTQLMW